jgi:hypothetical protein
MYFQYLVKSIEDIVRHVILNHSLGNQDFVEGLVVGPDRTKGGFNISVSKYRPKYFFSDYACTVIELKV